MLTSCKTQRKTTDKGNSLASLGLFVPRRDSPGLPVQEQIIWPELIIEFLNQIDSQSEPLPDFGFKMWRPNQMLNSNFMQQDKTWNAFLNHFVHWSSPSFSSSFWTTSYRTHQPLHVPLQGLLHRPLLGALAACAREKVRGTCRMRALGGYASVVVGP